MGKLEKQILELGLDWDDRIFRKQDYSNDDTIVSYRQLLREIIEKMKGKFPKIKPSHGMDPVHDFNEWFEEWLE